MNQTEPLSSCFFATYLSDEMSPECISRICNIRMTKIEIPKILFKNPCKEVYIALSIRDSKHLLRSSPIVLSDITGDTYVINVDFTFSIRYSHYSKRKYNILNIFLERRRTLNNKTVSRHKTIASSLIDLSWY
ncbi:hypothetical protein HZS_7581 [Henneguya salminicola]|uniref:Phosphofurin acidic cluster sorting protein 2 (Trinotate prediction) n=1 Tax=Henneguya salminicola TaxID=69463 RepID=A0A6G3MI34_HENSL|nr:hypothetical protein HZS_7581 [Henneguya salminicola]